MRLRRRVRGILVAPSITSSALKLIREKQLEYVKIKKPPVYPFERVVVRERGQKGLGEF